MNKRPIRIGLDLDGVILYNPARIGRPLITFAKKFILGKKKKTFTIPKSALEKYIWYLLHKTSLFQASGFDDIRDMAKTGQIEAYIITGRFSFLKDDLEKWLKKINSKSFIKEWYYNKNDEQPHYYKEKLIDKLGLDFFVEDNWDIVHHLSQTSAKKNPNLKVLWIYNIFDRGIPYKHKFPSLKSAAQYVKSLI